MPILLTSAGTSTTTLSGTPANAPRFGDIDLEVTLVIVDQAVNDRHLLFACLLGAKRFDQAGFGVIGNACHLGDAFFQVFDKIGARQLRVRSTPRLAKPIFLGRQVGMIPPTPAPWCVTNRHAAVHLVLMNRAACHLDIMRARGDVRIPELFTLGRNPLVEQRIGILPLVDKVRQPDVMVQTGRLPGQIFFVLQVQAQPARRFRRHRSGRDINRRL